jgi:acyl carrier protein
MTPENTTTKSRLEEVFHDVFGDDSIHLEDATTAEDIEAWDSLQHIRLLLAIETAFSIRFGVGEGTSLRNVGELIEKIDDLRSQ